jgi:pimeloyl-ACP methyl ester carboxylesterase
MQSTSISYRAYAIDLWGFGDTSKRPEKYSLDRQVDLVEGFLQNMGIGKVAIIGHGLGAIVGLKFALINSSYVDRILLTAYPFSYSALSQRLRTATIDELAYWLLSRLPAGESARVDAPKADQNAIMASLDELQGNEDKLIDTITNIQKPTILVFGQNDPAIEAPPHHLLEELPEYLHYIIFEQSGHFPMLDEPRKYNRLMIDFLSLSSGESPKKLQLKEEWKRRVR